MIVLVVFGSATEQTRKIKQENVFFQRKEKFLNKSEKFYSNNFQ